MCSLENHLRRISNVSNESRDEENWHGNGILEGCGKGLLDRMVGHKGIHWCNGVLLRSTSRSVIALAGFGHSNTAMASFPLEARKTWSEELTWSLVTCIIVSPSIALAASTKETVDVADAPVSITSEVVGVAGGRNPLTLEATAYEFPISTPAW